MNRRKADEPKSVFLKSHLPVPEVFWSKISRKMQNWHKTFSCIVNKQKKKRKSLMISFCWLATKNFHVSKKKSGISSFSDWCLRCQLNDRICRRMPTLKIREGCYVLHIPPLTMLWVSCTINWFLVTHSWTNTTLTGISKTENLFLRQQSAMFRVVARRWGNITYFTSTLWSSKHLEWNMIIQYRDSYNKFETVSMAYWIQHRSSCFRV